MRQIQLTKGQVALVNDADYESLNQYKWYAHKWGHTYYAVRKASRSECGQPFLFMHRVILNVPNGVGTDHINGNGLDNRRLNLRNCSVAQNQWNQRLHQNNTSGYKGVDYVPEFSVKQWRAQIQFKGKRLHLGLYGTAEEAARSYDEAAWKYHGDFASTNKTLGLLG